MFFTSTQLLIVPSIFAFLLKLSKIKSRLIKIVQRTLIAVNMTAFLLLVIIIVAPVDTVGFLSSPSFNIWYMSLIILSFYCLPFLVYKWIRTAKLKRDRMQVVTMTIVSTVVFSSLFAVLAFPNSDVGITTYIGTLIFIIVCNYYANQYNSFSFNVSNLAEYVYSAVNLPVIILDASGDIMLCNTSSESFFQKSAGQLNKLKLFDLFNF